MTATAQNSPVSLVVVNSATGDWRLDVYNRTGETQDIVISMPMHPDGDESGRTWTLTEHGVTGSVASDGADAIDLSGFTLDNDGVIRIFGRSTFAAEAKRVSVLYAVTIGTKDYSGWIHFFPGMDADPKLIGNDVDMPKQFFDQEAIDELLLDGFYNGRWTISNMIDYMRTHATDVAFNPDGITIQVIGDQAVVAINAAIISGLAEGAAIPPDASSVVLGLDLGDESLHPLNMGGMVADIADLYANDALLASSISGKQPLDATLTALAGLAGSADSVPMFTASDVVTLITITAAARSVLQQTSNANMQSALGLAIGTDVQAYDAELAAIAGLTSAADRLPYFTGSGTASLATFTAAGRALVDDADAAAQATTLGLGTGNTPQFTGIELGHASDTTITRSAAGVLAVEGYPLSSSVQVVNTQSGASYTLAATDLGKVVERSYGSAQTLTVPRDSDVTWPLWGWCEVYVSGAGQLTVQAGTGATLRLGGPTAKSSAQHARLGLQKVAADTWLVWGYLAAS